MSDSSNPLCTYCEATLGYKENILHRKGCGKPCPWCKEHLDRSTCVGSVFYPRDERRASLVSWEAYDKIQTCSDEEAADIAHWAAVWLRISDTYSGIFSSGFFTQAEDCGEALRLLKLFKKAGFCSNEEAKKYETFFSQQIKKAQDSSGISV